MKTNKAVLVLGFCLIAVALLTTTWLATLSFTALEGGAEATPMKMGCATLVALGCWGFGLLFCGVSDD